MKHSLHLAGRVQAAVLFTAIGLVAYGCGDSATVNPEVELSRLSVSPGTLQPAFSGGTTQYSVNLTNDTTTVTVSAQPAVSGDRVTIDGQETTSRTIRLDPPGSTTVVDVVVSESNTSSRTYTVRLVRAGLAGNNSLQSLAVSPGTLAPAFAPNTLPYTVTVASNVGSVDVTPTAQDSKATMTVNGQAAISGQARTIPLNSPGQSTTVTITVTAQDGTPKTYLVTVSRGVSNNNNLQRLTISPGTLAPSFNAGTTDYTVNVANTVQRVTVTPTLQDTTATMTVNGQTTTSGQARAITLRAAGLSTFVTIVVTAQNGTQKTYILEVNRAALAGNNNLQSLAVSPGPLAPAFTQNTLNYTVNVASTVTSVNVSATKADPNAVMSEDVTAGSGTATGQAAIQLGGQGTATVVLITVTAPNGNSKTYRVTVNRAAPASNNNLSALSVTPGPLSPAFNANTTNYTVDVGSVVSSISVTPRLQDTAATMTVNGQATTSGQARAITLLAAGLSTSIPIVVTAPNGSSKTYTITVERAAVASNNNLSALSVTPGPLAPAFAQNTLNYTVNVASTVTSVNVSATKADANAVMSGDVTAGTGVATGQAAIPLNGAGTSTPVSITVTAPNGSSKEYAITVNRAAPAAPAAPTSAPDLIAADDSCPRDAVTNECLPGTSDSDNITNVNTPRFTIPPPGAGETPSLHVDGSSVPASFFLPSSILQPTSALADGVHSITYTLTNGGGESSPSPALSVTIDTVAPGVP